MLIEAHSVANAIKWTTNVDRTIALVLDKYGGMVHKLRQIKSVTHEVALASTTSVYA